MGRERLLRRIEDLDRIGSVGDTEEAGDDRTDEAALRWHEREAENGSRELRVVCGHVLAQRRTNPRTAVAVM